MASGFAGDPIRVKITGMQYVRSASGRDRYVSPPGQRELFYTEDWVALLVVTNDSIGLVGPISYPVERFEDAVHSTLRWVLRAAYHGRKGAARLVGLDLDGKVHSVLDQQTAIRHFIGDPEGFFGDDESAKCFVWVREEDGTEADLYLHVRKRGAWVLDIESMKGR